MDGVLVRSDRLHFEAWKGVCSRRGWLFDEKLNDRLRGVPRLDSLRIILRHNGLAFSEDEELRLADEKNAIFKESLKTLSAADLIPGALALAEGVRSLGAKTAICSSSRNAPAIAATLRLEPFFDAIVSAQDVAKAKPDPELFLTAAKRLGVPPALCVVVEDAQSGVDASLAAGMRCVGYGQPGSLMGATLLSSSFEDLSPERLLAPDAPAR
jgi:beta-phosphoglucomutase